MLGLRRQIADAARQNPSGAPVERDPHRRTPSSPISRWVRSRDGTCRAPGCRVPASACDIDHTVDHASGGLTTHDNLALLCRHHHRLKHDGGWRVTQPRPGVLEWVSPYGSWFRRAPG
ncbi:MAG TPA: HNH endonuclease signature motif containing protein [Micromonosporaceae bacterium]